MYGDSLLEASAPYVRSTTQLRSFGGTALCDRNLMSRSAPRFADAIHQAVADLG
jgi:hypothetical protein